MKQVGSVSASNQEAATAFSAALADLKSGQEQVQAIRPELCFEEVPAPRTLAPFATAVGVTVKAGDAEIASGRFVLLYDPAGQRGWGGPLRVIVYIRAEVEQEIAEDPMVGQVAWSWLTEALDARTAGYSQPSGTVTRVITEGFGAKGGEPPSLGFELRASWSPAAPGPPPADDEQVQAGPAGDEPAQAGLAGHLAAWCGAVCAASGLPPLAAGVTALRPTGRRRGQ
jgi:hypothetical protein